jgi:hypothetical protein
MGFEVATSKTLCDCGSGKLFRDCHLLLSLPKESFLVNITKKLKTSSLMLIEDKDKFEIIK